MRTIISALGLVLLGTTFSFAQNPTVKGRVLDAYSSDPILNATVQIRSSIFNATTNEEGLFVITGTNLSQGEQVLTVIASGYLTQHLRITIQNNETLHIDSILMELDVAEMEAQIGVISLTDTQLDQDDDISFSISGLLHASNDVFLNAAAFDFSATFFRPRGLDNAYGKVLINGIEMNKQYSGRPQWGNWGGLNDVLRNRESAMGLKANEYSFGGLAGTTNFVMRASQYRRGGRLSYASANRSYQGRVMGSYNSGLSKKGWAYSVLVSRRFGEEGYVEGTLYDANSFFISAEKKLNDTHSFNVTTFYSPNRRGRSSAVTQEVRDIKGIQYNPNWGYVAGIPRNSRIRTVEEPVIMFNHYWNMGSHTQLNTNVAYQFGKTSSTRIDNGGTRLLITPDGQESFVGGARNPLPNYYQRLPSFFLQDEDPSAGDFQNAFLAQQALLNDGQLDWNELYRANAIATRAGGNAIYVVQEDRTDDTQISLNTILNTRFSENLLFNGALNYRTLTSENFALLKDLLGGTGYLDVDFFAEDDVNIIVGNLAQSDLQQRNRLVQEGERYKYNYQLNANVISGFAQVQGNYRKIDFYVGLSGIQTSYQRNGLYENGNFPGNRSLGQSESLSFSDVGGKGGLTYKISGRHLVDINAGYYTKAPSLRNAFSNARQNNDVVIDLTSETIQSMDVGYIFRAPLVKARVTGYYASIKNATEIGFYFTENISGLGFGKSAFVQEVLTGIETKRLGGELGIEAQLTPTFKLKAAASVGQYTYANNPTLYLTSDDFEEAVSFGDGTAQLKGYHVAGGPERAYQLGFEYRDPAFWWIGATTNYFSNAYIDVNNLARTANFTSDFDGQPFNDYDENTARTLLKQEVFDSYFLINVIGGKSWRIKKYYVGFFATVNNVLNQEYRTGGFEQGRKTNFRDLQEDASRKHGALFGPRYFFGNGTTYYVNVYVRF